MLIGRTIGHCTVAIEIAGPSLPAYVPLIPYQIRYIANYVINKCVLERNGIGGFMTQGLDRQYRYLTSTHHIISDGFRKGINHAHDDLYTNI